MNECICDIIWSLPQPAVVLKDGMCGWLHLRHQMVIASTCCGTERWYERACAFVIEWLLNQPVVSKVGMYQ